MTEPQPISLFDGETLAGWTAVPRRYDYLYPGGPHLLDVSTAFSRGYQEVADLHPAVWTVEDGAIVGRQDAPGSGYGGYLVTNGEYGDFELTLDARPDWPADTGIMLRRNTDDWAGIQVLLDHRPSGSIGGFYGHGIGRFHAVPFALDAILDADGRPIGLKGDDSVTTVEPYDDSKRAMLTRAADLEDFLRVWRWDDWNTFRIRCVGDVPVITVWINDLLTAEIDMNSIPGAKFYSPEGLLDAIGTRGRIALEVHDNDPGLGERRWGPDAACRWRNLSLLPL